MTHPDTPELAVELFEAIKSSKASAVAVDVNELLPKLERLLAKRELEGRIAEIQRKISLSIELLSSKDFKAGFNEALDQLDAADATRLAELREELATYE